jgi:subtilisin family serine protease
VSWLRADPAIHPESYLPDDGAFRRVRAQAGWPAPFAAVTRALDPDTEGYRAAVRQASRKRIAVNAAGAELDAIGAPQVWSEEQGDGVRLAVIDTGIDVNHASLAGNLLEKPSEREGDDFDGNGVPGDRFGVNLAQLAIARGDDGTRLALARRATSRTGTARSPHAPRLGPRHRARLAVRAAAVTARSGVAPRAQIIAVDVQENLRTTLTQRDDDPRMHDSEQPPAELRSSTWARAAGIAYAVGERARADLRVARRRGALDPARRAALRGGQLRDRDLRSRRQASASGAYPSRWRESFLEGSGGGMGVIWDPWTDEESGDPILRPLRALVVAEVTPTAGTSPDLVLPQKAIVPGGTHAAVSNPRNDASSVPDRRSAPLVGSAAAVGLTAGAAVIVTAAHPDLEPWAVREALVTGAAKSPAGALSVPGALAATGRLEQGGACRALLRREPTPEASPWPKIKIKTNADQPYGAPPASPEPEDAQRRR